MKVKDAPAGFMYCWFDDVEPFFATKVINPPSPLGWILVKVNGEVLHGGGECDYEMLRPGVVDGNFVLNGTEEVNETRDLSCIRETSRKHVRQSTRMCR